MSHTRNFAEVIRAKLDRDPQLKLDVELAAEISELEIAHAALVAERDALQRFKAWVHAYLDRAGIPTHPDGLHSKEGCRIGDRMDILKGERDALRTACEAAQRFIRNGVEFGYIRMPEAGDSALETLPMIDTALAAGRGPR